MLKIFITGHRRLLKPEKVRQNINNSLTYFQGLDHKLEAYSAVAIGADTIFAQEALAKNIPLKISIPFGEEEYKKDFHGDDLAILDHLLATYSFDVPHPSHPTNKEEKSEGYFAVGKSMVDKADIVLAVWDGEEANGKGGTADIINYAKEKGIPLHIIKAERIPKEGEKVYVNEYQQQFDALDTESKKYKNKRFQYAWMAGIILGVLAVICFAIPLSFSRFKEQTFFFSCGEVIFLLLSYFSLVILAKRWKKHFLKKRRAAEYLRSLIWFKDGKIPVARLDELNYDPGADITKIEKDIINEQGPLENLENAKRLLWIFAYKQIKYHTKDRIAKFTRKIEKAEKWLLGLRITFLAILGSTICIEFYEHFIVSKEQIENFSTTAEPVLEILKFAWIILPSIYAAVEGARYFGEWKRNIAESKKMIKLLKRIKAAIRNCSEENVFNIIVKQFRDHLELENSGWAEMVMDRDGGFHI